MRERDHHKDHAHKHQSPTAGPAADDRYGAGRVASNLETRILAVHVVEGRTRITIACGKNWGIHTAMEGYVRAGLSMLADFQIDQVELHRCHAFVDVTPDQLKSAQRVVINPTSKPGASASAETPARVIGVWVEQRQTKVILSHGFAHGIRFRGRGELRSANGHALSFVIDGVTANQSFAIVTGTVDEVNAHPQVVLFSPGTNTPIQRRATGGAPAADVQATASAGVASASSALPHLDAIQRSFGKHDVSSIRAQVGGAATSATNELGAQAYATGDRVAFASTPDLHTAAHEAAHVIQQQRGAVGFQGLGAADDEHERHADAVADAVVAGKSAEALLDNLSGIQHGDAIQRKAAPAHQWQLAAPDKIDLGDNVVERRTKHTASIFALHREQGPRIRAALNGDPSIKLVSSPLFLPGASAPYDQSKAFQFEHRPPQKGLVDGTLEVEILDAPFETFKYPVIAAAHNPGEPTLAEQQNAADRKAREQSEADKTAKERERAKREIAAEYERDTHYHSGHYRKLDELRGDIDKAIVALFKSRRDGLQDAHGEIGEFVRQTTIAKPSLLEQLAILALDMATAGIAGAIAKRLEAALSTVLKLPVPKYLHEDARYPRIEREQVPSRTLVAIITDGLKEGVKKSTKLHTGEPDQQRTDLDASDVGRSSDGDTYATRSTDPKTEFFVIQRERLNADEGDFSDLATFTRDSLLPTLQTNPQAAIAAMKAIVEELKGERIDAGRRQMEQTVRAWVRYLAESSREGASLNGAFDDKHHAPSVDGVIDLVISPNLRHPELPVAVVGARINGVKKAVMQRIARQPLINLDLPVRASGGFDGSPSATLTVVRESGGRIEYTENLGERARWLERKAMANGGGADAEAGARLLLERELMTKTLIALTPTISNDSKETK